jgi:hypothetical protein
MARTKVQAPSVLQFARPVLFGRAFAIAFLLVLSVLIVCCQERSIAPVVRDDGDISWMQQSAGHLSENRANTDAFEVQLLIGDRESVSIEWSNSSVYYYALGRLGRVMGLDGVMQPGRKYLLIRVAQSRGRSRSFAGCNIRISGGPLRGVLLKVWPGEWSHDVVTWAIYCLPRSAEYRFGPIPHQVVSILAK